MCHHIQPRSVASYLSGICNQLESFFPEVRTNRRHHLVTKTLAGCQRLRSVPIKRKELLSVCHLIHALASYAVDPSHNDILFVCQLLTGFHSLMRLGELVWLDKPSLQDYCKVTPRSSVKTTASTFEFVLPSSKTDRTFSGDHILIKKTESDHNAHRVFMTYLASCVCRFPYNAELLLRENSKIPTYNWFINRMHKIFPNDIAGHSIRSGGATALAEANVAPHLIMAIGHWSSEAWRRYIRKHPVLLAFLVYS